MAAALSTEAGPVSWTLSAWRRKVHQWRANSTPRAYPPEFRRKILDLVRAGRRVDDLADEFDVGHQTIRNWLKQDDLDGGRRSDGLTTVDHEEVVRLRKRVRQLEIEREVLSKATAWFARETDVVPSKSTDS
jgi:transposase